jgi:hypothetical protein
LSTAGDQTAATRTGFGYLLSATSGGAGSSQLVVQLGMVGALQPATSATIKQIAYPPRQFFFMASILAASLRQPVRHSGILPKPDLDV